MTTFTFRLDHPDQDPIVRTRRMDDEAQAMAYARQMLGDWPESLGVDVTLDGELVSRLRRPPD